MSELVRTVLPPGLHAALRELAAEVALSESALVRSLIAGHMARLGRWAPDEVDAALLVRASRPRRPEATGG